MNIRFSELKQAMIGNLNRNNVVANNLANVNSNGYKRDVMFSELMQTKGNQQLDTKIKTDFSQGSMTQTNNPLDLAISGSGFFTIDDGEQTVYTRDGHFSRGADGLLRTTLGQPVMGQTGWIDLGSDGNTPGVVRITMQGDVYVDDAFVDRLEISSFEKMSDLEKIGSNLFKAKPGTWDDRVVDPKIIQGKIEGSNVAAIHEMVELIDIQRSFETAQKTLRTLDDAMGKAANNIGNYR